jgi:tRNA-Thr(GGU) m(6)t(6)A37 methyltransferase TsaA
VPDLKIIGTVRSSLTDAAAAPKQGSEGAPDARIELAPEMAAAVAGLAAGDRLMIVTWLHRARRDLLQVHPRDDPARPLRGVFGTRSADRPNPLGLHEVQLLAIEGTTLHVAPLEAIDGTPVVDVKVAL